MVFPSHFVLKLPVRLLARGSCTICTSTSPAVPPVAGQAAGAQLSASGPSSADAAVTTAPPEVVPALAQALAQAHVRHTSERLMHTVHMEACSIVQSSHPLLAPTAAHTLLTPAYHSALGSGLGRCSRPEPGSLAVNIGNTNTSVCLTIVSDGARDLALLATLRVVHAWRQLRAIPVFQRAAWPPGKSLPLQELSR